MEAELKKRLEYPNSSVKLQAVQKLYDEVRKKNSTGGVITSANEIPALRLLLEHCFLCDRVVNQACCSALIKLVQHGVTDFTFTLNGFLNVVPSASNPQCIVWAVGQLMILQAEMLKTRDHEGSQAIYSIRSPPHPFITIIANCPNVSSSLLEQFHFITDHSCDNINSWETLMPFLWYILTDPAQPQSTVLLRFGILNVVTKSIISGTEAQQNKATKFLIEILPCLPVYQDAIFSDTTELLADILDSMAKNSRSCELVCSSLLLCLHGLTKGRQCLRLCQSLVDAGSRMPESYSRPECLVIAADLLAEADGETAVHAIQIAHHAVVNSYAHDTPLAPLMMLPVLQYISTFASLSVYSSAKSAKLSSTAAKIVELIRQPILKKCEHKDEAFKYLCMSITSEGYKYCLVVRLVKELWRDDRNIVQWLKSLQGHLEVTERLSQNLMNVVAAICVTASSEEVLRCSLATLIIISRKCPPHAPSILPLVLYRLANTEDAASTMIVLKTLPEIASNKMCVGPVLKTIKALALYPKMRPICVRLLASLWMQQNRCFPELHHILKDTTLETAEFSLVKAATIRDICRSSPEKYGPNVLDLVSSILSDQMDDGHSSEAALAVDALYHLCEAEVLDVMSAWSILQAKLADDKRPAVIRKLCKLFSVVPKLEVNTEQFEQFVSDVLHRLWSLTEVADETIVAASYQALACFSVTHFKIMYLPRAVTDDFVKQAELLLTQQDDEGATIDTVLPFVPGACFTRLLKKSSPSVTKHVESLLLSLVAKEVTSLPRGVYHVSIRQKTTAEVKAVSTIPAFLQSQHSQTDQPDLRPEIAAGLLFAFDPTVEVGRDGRPRRHYIIKHGKSYQQMLNTLLYEVPLQSSDWHHLMLLPQAWVALMGRTCTAMLEGKNVELQMQAKEKGEEVTSTEAEAQIWVRDTLLDMLVAASRGSPPTQSNAVMAISGLAIMVKNWDSLNDNRSDTWLTSVVDSLLKLIDSSYNPTAKLVGLCHQKSHDDLQKASVLAQAAACVALGQLFPLLVSGSVDHLLSALKILSSYLPSVLDEDVPPLLVFQSSLGTGLALAGLFKEHLTDIIDAKGMMNIWKSIDVLEEMALNPAMPHRAGCILGVGHLLCAMCIDSRTDIRAHVCSRQQQLYELWQTTDTIDSSFEPLSVVISLVSSAAFLANIDNDDFSNTALHSLLTKSKEYPQLSGLSLSVGILLSSLCERGIHSGQAVRNQLLAEWTQIDKSVCAQEKMARLKGLMALLGSERAFIPIGKCGWLANDSANSRVTVDVCMNMMRNSDDPEVQGQCTWLLGHFYQSSSHQIQLTGTTAPSDYGYLPESSVLRAVIDYVQECARVGPEGTLVHQLVAALNVVHGQNGGVLPPFNWIGVLYPLMRLRFGPEVQRLCLLLAVSQSSTSPTVITFINSWTDTPVLKSLAKPVQQVLLSSIPALSRSMPTKMLEKFLSSTFRHELAHLPQSHDTCITLMQGLSEALQINSQKEDMQHILIHVLDDVYKQLRSNPHANNRLYAAVAQCFVHVPDEAFDCMTVDDFAESSSLRCGVFIRCHLVSSKRQSIKLLNSCVDAIIVGSECDHDMMLAIMCVSFHLLRDDSDLNLRWLVELLGHVKNLMTGVITLQSDVDMKQVCLFLIQVVSAALSVWVNDESLPVLGLSPSILLDPAEAPTMHGSELGQSLLRLLPASMDKIREHPWTTLLPKLLDWLCCMAGLSQDFCSAETQHWLLCCLTSLRHTEEFRKSWTKVFSLFERRI